MRHILSILAVLLLCAAPAQAQTLKALMFNSTNGQVVANTGTNVLTFTNTYVKIGNLILNEDGIFYSATNGAGLDFQNTFFKDASGNVVFDYNYSGAAQFHKPIAFNNASNAATTRTNLGLGGTNIATFAGLTNNGDITIANTTASNGLLFIRRTNNEAFLGMANLIASNNTTVSNETLFRVGVAEATNRSAQFGFRSVRTNNGGEGFATFSVFGYNALMMIGPSDRSRTNTATNAGIEADIWTITPTNRVMTLRDTNTGALTMHQDLGFNAGLTNTTPTNTSAPVVWMRVWVGSNSYRVPLYQ